MEFIRGVHRIQPLHRGCVLTIGNFDGVHLGHQAVIRRMQMVAAKLELPTVVMTFEPYPKEYFASYDAPARLTSWREKHAILNHLNVDRMLCVHFKKKFANLTADDFIEQLLIKKLAVKHLVIGDDFCFGRQRQGNFTKLIQAGDKHGFTVERTKSLCLDGQRVSSTAIRAALEEDDLATAATLLGRPYHLQGRVVHGQKLARTLGIPTANIKLYRDKVALSGVYVVKVWGVGQDAYFGVANVGRRPTVASKELVLEVHLLNFQGNLYQQQLQVIFLHKLRPENRFSSIEQLKQQINQDVVLAQQWLAHHLEDETTMSPSIFSASYFTESSVHE